MSNENQTDEARKLPIIVHLSLQDTEVAKILQQSCHRLRFSENIVPDSCIFPLSGIAFLIVSLQKITLEWPLANEVNLNPEVITRVEKLLQVHGKCYLIGIAAIHGDDERAVFSAIQKRFLFTHLQMLPAHNAQESVQCMLSIAKVTCKPLNAVLRQRIDRIVDSKMSSGAIYRILQRIGLEQHECHMVEDGLGSLGRIASATEDELLACSIDRSAANKILTYFEADAIL